MCVPKRASKSRPFWKSSLSRGKTLLLQEGERIHFALLPSVACQWTGFFRGGCSVGKRTKVAPCARRALVVRVSSALPQTDPAPL